MRADIDWRRLVPISDIGRASSGTRAKLVRSRDLASERRHNRVQKQGPFARREAGMMASILLVVVKAAMSLMGAHESGGAPEGHHQENRAL